MEHQHYFNFYKINNDFLLSHEHLNLVNRNFTQWDAIREDRQKLTILSGILHGSPIIELVSLPALTDKSKVPICTIVSTKFNPLQKKAARRVRHWRATKTALTEMLLAACHAKRRSATAKCSRKIIG